MHRRDLLRTSLLGMAAFGLPAGWSGRALGAVCETPPLPRMLVNLMLQGGADFRFLFMPAPSHPDALYLDRVWEARRGLYDGAYGSYDTMFDNEYLLVDDPRGGPAFGVFNGADWLASEFQAGRVAVVANAVCSENRRHDQSILNADAGEPWLEQLNFDRDGWGGRLVEAIGTPARAVELGQRMSLFNKGTQAADRLQNVIHARDLRDMALADVNPDLHMAHPSNVMARSLRAWYEGAKADATLAPDSVYQTFLRHRDSLDAFGARVEARLGECGELPDALLELELNDAEFAQQCRNLYDSVQLADLLEQRVMSMNYGGWDTHDNQYAEITPRLTDLFGREGGLATTLSLMDQLDAGPEGPRNQLLLHFASDFGRQLAANGAAGTDHGSGNYGILMGRQLRGGVYGEMFPEAEARTTPEGWVPLETGGADIEGRTSTERILAAIGDWAQPGASAAVAPNAGSSRIEAPGLLDELLAV